MLQLSLVGHPDHTQLKVLSHPYSVRRQWPTLMDAVAQTHGPVWMQTLDCMLGDAGRGPEERRSVLAQLLVKLRAAVIQPAPSMDWGSGTNVSANEHDATELQAAADSIEQHNLPESSVVVSFLEQAWEFFQHDSQADFARILASMLKLGPSDRHSAFTAYHLEIMEELLKRGGRDRAVTHSLATVLAGVLYAGKFLVLVGRGGRKGLINWLATGDFVGIKCRKLILNWLIDWLIDLVLVGWNFEGKTASHDSGKKMWES